jgi:D-arabinono-1,4-lactone oxidase
MEKEINSHWLKAGAWVKIYSWITVFAVIYGIAAAHIPFLIGHPWTSCDGCSNECWCVITFHLYEVPLVLYNAYIAWYGLNKYSIEGVQSYMSLLSFSVTMNLAFFTFEIILLYTNLHSGAFAWENILLTSVALILCGGSFLGIYVKQLLVDAVYQHKK